ncbi:hypothetical protein DBR47_24175 [Paucibacter sp. KBW04]|uniref:hypothetical protein n=1 Tax=Paucibacter sp. KBW04 TaxID=2153361 RepID=UPI000F56BE59|nr:hypothetical protein [Paucibacter sp. KBW04]RQO53412.1 hypothetical protein DBR47_24175 [Paucibacter sp. KBW04]
MTEHILCSEYLERPITIRMGWDRSLQGFFMSIEFAAEVREAPIYSHLTDPELRNLGGFADDLAPLIRTLKRFELTVPESMLQEVRLDGMLNKSGCNTRWNAAGEVISS